MKSHLILLVAAFVWTGCNQKSDTKRTTTNDDTVAKSPDLNQTLPHIPVGPDTSVKITEAYARMVARDAYF